MEGTTGEGDREIGNDSGSETSGAVLNADR
jgi:hypothetical protein